MPKKLLALIIILVLIVGVLIWGHDQKLWFTPEASQKKTVQSFFSDISANNYTAAYNLTTAKYKAANGLTYFKLTFGSIANAPDKLTIINYLNSNKGLTSMTGSVLNKNSGKVLKFGFNLVEVSGSYRVDSMAVNLP